MPISSGFGQYQTNYSPRKPIVRSQIIMRSPKFRENQRNKNQTDSKATAGGKLPPQRSTAVVKQPFRSDTFTLPTKRDETNFKVPHVKQAQNGSQRPAANKPAVVNYSPPTEQKDIMRKNVGNRPTIKQLNQPMDRQNLQRKPVRFANDYNNTSSHASPPVYYQRSAPLADPLDNSRRMRITSDDYTIHRRKNSPAYAYNDYHHTVSDIPTISYRTSLPPITQTKNQTAPTVVIRPQEISYPDPPPPAPMIILPPAAPPPSTMFLPNSTIHPYTDAATTTFYTTLPPQPPPPSYFLPPPPQPTYFPQPLLLPFPYSNPNPPAPPPPPPQPQTVINQTTSSNATVSSAVKSENITEGINGMIIVRPNTTSNQKNITIQLGVRDNPQRVVRVVNDPPYRQVDDLVYIDSEPKRVIYEPPPPRRTAVIRRPPPTEYVYMDESPSNVIRRHPHRSEVVYIDNDRPLEYEQEIVYVDDFGNQIDYIYDDEPAYHRRNYRKSHHHPSSTNIVYK